MSDGVAVHYEEILVAAEQYGTDPLSLQLLAAGAPAETLASLVAAIEGTDNGLDSGTRVAVQDVAATSAGAAVIVCNHGGAEGLGAWLSQLRRALDATGQDGELVVGIGERAPTDFPAPRRRCALAAVVLTRQVSEDDFETGWNVAEEAASAIAREARDWCLAGAGELYFSHHGVSSQAEPDQAFGLLELALGMRPPFALTNVSSHSGFRRVLFDALGHVLFEAEQTSHGTDPLGELTQLLKNCVAWIDYGLVRLGSGPSEAWWEALSTDEPIPPAVYGPYYALIGQDEAVRVPDAYGVQVLTGDHMSNARDLSRWDVVTLDGRYLVSAKREDLWFSPGGPKMEVVQSARHDFGGMIITDEYIRELRARKRLEKR